MNGNLFLGQEGSGNYYGAWSPDGGFSSVSASLVISGAVVDYSVSGSYTPPPELISEGYETGYWIEGYWLNGYWTDGYYENGFLELAHYDENGNWVDERWNPGDWVEGVWIDGDWVPEQWIGEWVPAVWNYPDLVNIYINESGTYQRFAFQMSGGTPVQPADSTGNPWSATPQLNIPRVSVAGVLWDFNATDVHAGYDYFTPQAGEGYLWVTSAFYGGYDPAVGTFSGCYSNGLFRDTSTSFVRIMARNGDGTFLAFGTPSEGRPARIWTHGLTFRYLTHDTTNDADVYLTNGGDLILLSLVQGQVVVSGYGTGTYQNETFTIETGFPCFAATENGSPLPAGSAPHWGPPAIAFNENIWHYRGSTGTEDYYGGKINGQWLSVSWNGVVESSRGPGLYAGGVFQNLPGARSVTPSGEFWSTLPPNSGYPPAVLVDGQLWYYSSTQSHFGRPSYLGPQSGQVVTISGDQAVFWDPVTATYRMGTYANGSFTFPPDSPTVAAANTDGTPYSGGGGSGDLDVPGSLTLGTWLDASGYAVNGLAISFTPASTSLLRFDATKFVTDWLWTRVTASGATEPKAAMRLSSSNVLTLYTTAGTPAPGIVLDPNGRSRFDRPVRIAPQGDIPMGEFAQEPAGE